jgi:ribosomal protein L37AE/L43A
MYRVPANECPQCGAQIIAAEWSEHLSETRVRNVWSCDGCGYQFEDTVYLPLREQVDAVKSRMRLY